jgi:putative redox protein
MAIQANYTTGMQFEIETSSGHYITIDGSEPHTGVSPMEMLLVGLVGCMGVSVISILQKKRQNVTAYQLRVHGTRATEHPRVFTEITVEHIVTGHHIQPEAVARSIELGETRYCGASAMLGKTAKITNTFQIIEA